MKFAGMVRKHIGRGTRLGFPTANLDAPQGTEEGIWLAEVEANHQTYHSLVFIGAAETFGETEKKAEVYLLDFEGPLNGSLLAVTLIKKLRDSKRFDSAEELVVQMKDDERMAREYFKSNK